MNHSIWPSTAMAMQIFISFLLFFFLPSCAQPEQNKMLSDTPEKKILLFDMLDIQGGAFLMGGTDNSHTGQGRDECPHEVTLKNFSIGKYEVTQAQWKEIMGDNPSYFTGNDNNPVEQVSWEDVQLFIRKLNAKYSEHFRLPTEQEWEFAARGGLKSKNFRYSGSNDASGVAWWQSNSGAKPHPVGILKPNELGIYDMSGNISEWCADWKLPYPCDTQGKSFAGTSRILRGGMFSNDSSSVRVRDRNGRGVTLRLNTLGFRLAK
jgi:formylglycine-generating enzyme